MFADLDPTLLDSPGFKEDSVREEIIVPLLKRLGYSASGPYRIVRSKTLAQPFIFVGTGKHPVTIIPDYTLLHEEKPILILDAKAPTEDVLSKANVQQAYSYAIHPEIKCKTFALCNGHQLAVFSTEQGSPQLLVGIRDFEKRWNEIESHLAPKYLLRPELRNFAPDLGFRLKQLGITEVFRLHFLGVQLNLFARVSDTLLTGSGNCVFCEAEHCATFDFSPKLLPSILRALLPPLADQFRTALGNSPFQVAAEGTIAMDIRAHLGPETRGLNEVFIPLVIDEISGCRFIAEPVIPEADDIPPHVFRLRRAYKIVRPQFDPNAPKQ